MLAPPPPKQAREDFLERYLLPATQAPFMVLPDGGGWANGSWFPPLQWVKPGGGRDGRSDPLPHASKRATAEVSPGNLLANYPLLFCFCLGYDRSPLSLFPFFFALMCQSRYDNEERVLWFSHTLVQRTHIWTNETHWVLLRGRNRSHDRLYFT